MNPPSSSSFAPTRWTLVLQARGRTPEARAALSDLCAICHAPVREFVRQWLHGAGGADDLTQEFFAEILTRGHLGDPDPERGRFRSFLLGAVKHFLSHARERARAQKQGGGAGTESLDAGIDIPDPALPPDSAFDRHWARLPWSKSKWAICSRPCPDSIPGVRKIHAIADFPDRNDEARAPRIVAQNGPQTGNDLINSPCTGERAPPGHGTQQCIARECPSR